MCFRRTRRRPAIPPAAVLTACMLLVYLPQAYHSSCRHNYCMYVAVAFTVGLPFLLPLYYPHVCCGRTHRGPAIPPAAALPACMLRLYSPWACNSSCRCINHVQKDIYYLSIWPAWWPSFISPPRIRAFDLCARPDALSRRGPLFRQSALCHLCHCLFGSGITALLASVAVGWRQGCCLPPLKLCPLLAANSHYTKY